MIQLVVLDNDAVEIGELYRASRNNLAESVRYAYECGVRLIEKKTSLGHGNWEQWIEANRDELGFSDPATAWRLMKVARSNLAPAQDLGPLEAATISRQIWGHANKTSEPDNEWYTPQWLFDAIGLTYSIDVCAAADRTYSCVPAAAHYSLPTDGLHEEWRGTVWCNPPYSTPAPWAERMIQHNDGLFLTHIPMNAEWCVDVWRTASCIRLFQAMDFMRPDGSTQRPGYWLQLAAFGDIAGAALIDMVIPDGLNPRRIPSPAWTTG